jgi:Protein tyrosine and serine/threonine kinase
MNSWKRTWRLVVFRRTLERIPQFVSLVVAALRADTRRLCATLFLPGRPVVIGEKFQEAASDHWERGSKCSRDGTTLVQQCFQHSEQLRIDNTRAGQRRRRKTLTASGQFNDDSIFVVAPGNASRTIEPGASSVSAEDVAKPVRWVDPLVWDSNEFSKASDVYSFGVVLWELLARTQSKISDAQAQRILVGEQQIPKRKVQLKSKSTKCDTKKNKHIPTNNKKRREGRGVSTPAERTPEK